MPRCCIGTASSARSSCIFGSQLYGFKKHLVEVFWARLPCEYNASETGSKYEITNSLLLKIAALRHLNLLVDAKSLSSITVAGNAAGRVPVDTVSLHDRDGQEPEPRVAAEHLLPIATLANVEGVFRHRLGRVSLLYVLNRGDVVQSQICRKEPTSATRKSAENVQLLTNVEAGEAGQHNGAQQHQGENDANFKRLASHLRAAVSGSGRKGQGSGACNGPGLSSLLRRS